MIPLKDDNPRSTPPVVTVVIILANVIAFYFEIRYGFDPVITRFGAVPSDILPGLRLETLFTSMFLHGGFVAGMTLILVFPTRRRSK